MRVLLCCLSLLVVHFSIETFKAKKTNEGKKTSVRRVSINKYIHVSLLDISKLRHTSLSLSLLFPVRMIVVLVKLCIALCLRKGREINTKSIYAVGYAIFC